MNGLTTLSSLLPLVALSGCIVVTSSGDTDQDDTTSVGSSGLSSSASSSASSSDDASDSGSATDGLGSSSSGGTAADGSSTGAAAVPLELLDDGPHLGMIVGFEPPAPGTGDQVSALWDEAMDAGMDIARVQVDWAELEPEPGVYELDGLEQALIDYDEQGLQIMVTLSTIDSLEFTLPADLEDPKDPLGLSEGLSFDDPVVVDRFAGLLDAVVPLVVEHGGFLIAVGNEGDNAFGDRPELAPQIAGFTAAAKDHAATIAPTLEISTTLTYASASTLADVSAPIVDAVDVVTFNLYCENEDGSEITEDSIRGRIQAVLDAAEGKPVVIQELGCAAGYDDGTSMLANTPQAQRLFFEVFGQAMRDEPQLRAAYIFQLLDWSPSLTQLFTDELEALGFDDSVTAFFAEALSTVGLCRWEDATCRPAWDQVLEELAAL